MRLFRVFTSIQHVYYVRERNEICAIAENGARRASPSSSSTAKSSSEKNARALGTRAPLSARANAHTQTHTHSHTTYTGIHTRHSTRRDPSMSHTASGAQLKPRERSRVRRVHGALALTHAHKHKQIHIIHSPRGNQKLCSGNGQQRLYNIMLIYACTHIYGCLYGIYIACMLYADTYIRECVHDDNDDDAMIIGVARWRQRRWGMRMRAGRATE